MVPVVTVATMVITSAITVITSVVPVITVATAVITSAVTVITFVVPVITAAIPVITGVAHLCLSVRQAGSKNFQ